MYQNYVICEYKCFFFQNEYDILITVRVRQIDTGANGCASLDIDNGQ